METPLHARALAELLEASCADTPATFVAGARQTGKTTLVRAFDDAAWLTLDDLGTLAAARADPVGFVARLGPRTILDEVQRVPELFLPIKAAIDRDRRPGRFILTGSANVLALPRVADSLAGRMEILTLWPLSEAELAGRRAAFVDACFEGDPSQLALERLPPGQLLPRVLRGGYPEVVRRKDARARARWFDAYLTTLIQRDVRDLAAIEGLASLPRLLQAIASRAGSPLNLADLGRTIGMNQVTLKRYLTLLQTLYLAVTLPPWFENLGKRLAKTPKIYLNDSGLLAHLLGLDAGGLERQPAAAGPLVENFVVMELFKSAPLSRTRPVLHHLRTSDGHEVDVVLESRQRELVGLEVKAAASVSEADFKGLKLLRGLVGERLRCGAVLYGGGAVLPFGPGLWALPLQALWAGRRGGERR